MSDTSAQPTGGEVLDPNIRSQLNRLNEVQQEAAAAEARAAAAERELAFVRAGVDPANPVTELFQKAYDGPIETDAIKAAAAKYGIVGQSQAPANQAGNADLEAAQRAAQATTGASATENGGADLARRIAEATSQDEVMALVQSGPAIDPRAGAAFLAQEAPGVFT